MVSQILIHWIVIYQVDSAIQRLNNRRQNFIFISIFQLWRKNGFANFNTLCEPCDNFGRFLRMLYHVFHIIQHFAEQSDDEWVSEARLLSVGNYFWN